MTFQHTTRLLGLSGSTRFASLNTRLLALSRTHLASSVAMHVVSVDAFDLPVYDQDLEDDFPPGALELANLLRSSTGVVLASPEHNGSISAALKNAIDWVSRLPHSPRVFKDKPTLLMSASPGHLGGRHGLTHLRDILVRLGAQVFDKDVTVPQADVLLDDAENDVRHAFRRDLETVFSQFKNFLEVRTDDRILDLAGGVQ